MQITTLHGTIRRSHIVVLLVAANCAGGERELPVPGSARPLPPEAITLLPGPLLDARERNRTYLRSLDPQRLLHNFRVNAGLASSAEPLGGWERPDNELRGHFVGHYLTACALMVQADGDTALRRRAGTVVRGLADCQAALNTGGYLSAFPLELFDRVESGKKVWAPWYTIHKIMQGLLDMASLCGDTCASRVLRGTLDWAGRRIGRLSDHEMQAVLNVEFGGMGELLANAYRHTGKAADLDLARRFEKRTFTGPLAERTDRLKGLHANTHIPQAIAAARLFECTGERRYAEIAGYFWEQVVNRRTYVTGGTSNYEYWRTEPGTLAGELGDESHENCCTYNLLRLTRLLQTWGPSASRGDYYERALLNGILPTQHPADGGGLMYYVPMQAGSFKMFGVPDSSYWCCSGSGIESFATLAAGVWYVLPGGLLIDLFLPSRVEWKERGVTLLTETAYPDEETVRFTLRMKRPGSFTLSIRVPEWVAGPPEWMLNGARLKVDARPGSYARITRDWRDGDRLSVRFPMALRMVPLPGDSSLVSLRYGPVVLAAALGTERMTGAMQEGYGYPEVDRMFGEGAAMETPVVIPPSTDLREWIRPVPGSPLTFVTRGAAPTGELTLRPFSRLFRERYSIYLRTRTAAQWAAARAARSALPGWLLDTLRVGETVPEEEHNFQAWRADRGAGEAGAWVRSPLWFRYDLATRPRTAASLRLSLDAADTASFDILVDGVLLGTIPVRPVDAGIRTVMIALDAGAVADRSRIAVMLRSRNGIPTPRLYGLSIIREP